MQASNERVKKNMEGKLAEGQFGFREGRGAIDAIYVLNHLVNKELSKKKRKADCLLHRPKSGI